jgi:hypothetical protein
MIINPYVFDTGGGSYLPLTTAWIAATGESNTTILNALNTREASWASNGLTSKIIAQYPFVGGNSTKHAFNFMNTSLYNLSFFGFWTHSSTGALPNGSNAYATTAITGNTVFTQNDNHCSVYSRTNISAADKTAIGCIIGSTPVYALQIRTAANLVRGFNNSQVATQVASGANLNSSGYYLMNKTSSAIGGLTIDKNGTQIGANTVAITTNNYSTSTVTIGALNSITQFDNKEYGGVTFGLGLTVGERALMYTIEQQFQTDLSRQV